MNFLIGVSAHSVTFILQYTTQIANTTAKSSFIVQKFFDINDF